MQLAFKKKRKPTQTCPLHDIEAFRCKVNHRKPEQRNTDKYRGDHTDLISTDEPGVKTEVEFHVGLRPWGNSEEAGYLYHIFVNTYAGQYGKTWSKTDFVKAAHHEEAVEKVQVLAEAFLKECLEKDVAYLWETLEIIRN